MTVHVSFKNLLLTLGSDKRSGQVIVESTDQSADLWFWAGKIVRAVPGSDTDWPLGDILVEVCLLPRYKRLKIESESRALGTPPEDLLVQKNLVSAAVLKRLQDRLTIKTVLGFASDETVTATLESKDEEEIERYEWDAEIPVAYLIRELDRRKDALSRINIDVPDPEERFKKRPGTARLILGQQFEAGEQDDTGLSQDALRIFFFCDGSVRFGTLPIVTGIRLEETAALILQLKACGAIQTATDPVEHTSRDWSTDNLIVLAIRATTIFLAVVFIGLTAISTMGLYGSGTSTPLTPATQRMYQDSLEMVLAEHLNALNVYWHQQHQYPTDLTPLIDHGLIRSNSLNGRGIHGSILHNTTHGGLGFDLAISLDDRLLQVSWADGRPLMSRTQPIPDDQPE